MIVPIIKIVALVLLFIFIFKKKKQILKTFIKALDFFEKMNTKTSLVISGTGIAIGVLIFIVFIQPKYSKDPIGVIKKKIQSDVEFLDELYKTDSTLWRKLDTVQ